MDNEYKSYIEEKGTHFPTGIHTRINSQYRISTIFRRASTIQAMYFWESIVWDGDKIFKMESHYTIEAVLQYHYDEYFALGGL